MRRVVLSSFAFVLGMAQAEAQLKPKIMILFDTSGSMLANGTEDGSPLCSNSGQDSRLFQLKSALFDALQGMGATEVDFSLATFPQLVDATINPTCPAGHYYQVAETNTETNFSQDKIRLGCKLTTHSPTSQSDARCGGNNGVISPPPNPLPPANPCGPWYSSYKSQVLKVPFGRPPEDLMLYFDQQEDTDTQAPLSNPEIRAQAWTPLGKSLFYSYGYYHREVALPATDYRKKCERLAIAFFTDGEETCNISSDAYWPTKWAANLKTDLGVVTHTVAIDESSNLIQQIATSGGGTYVLVGADKAALKKAFLDIVAKSRPPSESCNGVDDDCDNLIDEDFPLKGQPCDNGKLGACYRAGVYACKPDGTGVYCTAPTATGSPEICDGIDNDCNGLIDDNVPGGCTSCIPQPEQCNGISDDCDVAIDEGIPSGPCGKDVGECTAGVTKCVAGKPICEGGKQATDEICDNKDNDCDGTIDGMGQLCYPFASGCDVSTGVCKGQCKVGNQTCTKGAWGACTGAVGPATEICDGVDNNCDGQVDEQAQCPGGSQCINGECSRECATGEFACPRGQLCKNGWCVQDRCDFAKCDAKGWICKSGECIDPCEDVTCPTLEKCLKGVCVDDSCYTKGCPSGERCIQGKCDKDLCAGVTCDAKQFCAQGSCVDLCDQKKCAAGQVCKVTAAAGGKSETTCVTDACADKTCGTGTVCKEGQCVTDPCFTKVCDKGFVCRKSDGTCVADVCEQTRCPVGYGCDEEGSCESLATSGKDLLAAGAGGCACDVQSSPWQSPSTLLWVTMALLALVVKRKLLNGANKGIRS